MLEQSYYLLFTGITVMYSVIFAKLSKSGAEYKNGLWIFATLFCLLITYDSLIISSDILLDFSLPPRLLIFIILPSFFLIFLFMRSKYSKKLIEILPNYLPIVFQSFRIIVELIIWQSYLAGFTSYQVSFEGYNYEIYFGISALVMGYLAYKKKVSNNILIAWNIFGLLMLAVIVSIFVTIVYFPHLWPEGSVFVDVGFINLPYMFIPAIFMPTAVMTHIFSIRQLLSHK